MGVGLTELFGPVARCVGAIAEFAKNAVNSIG